MWGTTNEFLIATGLGSDSKTHYFALFGFSPTGAKGCNRQVLCTSDRKGETILHSLSKVRLLAATIHHHSCIQHESGITWVSDLCQGSL